MKALIFILIVGLYFKVTEEKLFGNLVFFGRGQRTPPKYWGYYNNIQVSKRSKVFFPYHKNDNNPENSSSTDEAINYPLMILLSGKGNDEYSEVKFNIEGTADINLGDYTYFKSEMKIHVPKISHLRNEGYTCEEIGLSCTELKQYDFNKNNDWVNLIDFKLFLENSETSKSYEFDTFEKPTTAWKELQEKIGPLDSNIQYTSLVFRNYGKMPAYLLVGNSIFVKSQEEDIVIVKNGKFLDGFENWSWHLNNDNGYKITAFPDQICPIDPEEKNSLYFATADNYEFGFKVELSNNMSTFGPPEALSFKYRPMKYSTFNLNYNKNFTLSINEYLNARGCRVKPKEEVTVLIDLKYYCLTDSKLLMTNTFTTIFIQTVTNIPYMKAQIDESLQENYVDDVFFYDLTFHNHYPENLEPFTLGKSSTTGSCDITSHTHDTIINTRKRWPEETDKLLNSKNIVAFIEKIDDDTKKIDSIENNSAFNNFLGYHFKINIIIFIISIIYYFLL